MKELLKEEEYDEEEKYQGLDSYITGTNFLYRGAVELIVNSRLI